MEQASTASKFEGLPPYYEWLRLAVDARMWQRYSEALGKEHAAGGDQAFARAVDVAIRAAAVDTGAIEGLYPADVGFTTAVAKQEPTWEEQFQSRGPNARPLYEAQLHTYQLARQLTDSRIPITEAWIRQLHTELCTPQLATEPGLQLGQYKTEPNRVRRSDGSFHLYALPDAVQAAVRDLVAVRRTRDFAASHPVLQASYAHYGLTAIHPFKDGNGRVARTLASTAIFASLGIPLVVYVDQRNDYIDALEDADDGRLQPFVDFVFDRCIDAVRLVTDESRAVLADHARKLRELLTGPGGRLHAELDTLGTKIIQTLDADLQEQMQALKLPTGQMYVGNQHRVVDTIDPAHRGVPDSSGRKVVWEVNAQMVIPPPAQATVQLAYQLWIAKDRTQRYPFRILSPVGEDPFEVRLVDVDPQVRTDFKIRLKAWVRTHLDRKLPDLLGQAEDNVRSAGY